MRDLSWPAMCYLLALTIHSLVVVVLAVATLRDDAAAWLVLLVLALLFLLSESMPTPLTARHTAVSVSFSAVLAAIVLIGAEGAALVGATALITVRPNLPLVKRAFNGAQFALCGYAAGWVFRQSGGHSGFPEPGRFAEVILPFAGGAAVFISLNFVLLTVMLTLAGQRDHMPMRDLAQFVVAYAGYSTFGLLIAGLWATVQSIAAVLVLIPLFVARWAFEHYRAEQRSFEATIAALAQAVEIKDYYTRGHCARVSRAATMIAREIDMSGERLEALRYAGMLHDVGKLGVPTRVLRKQGALTEDEFAAVQLHPMRGLEIVRDIDFLDEAFAGIVHHHERVHGRGYPMGLAGEEIPQFARILGVADAFDAMTTDRSYRGARSIEEAVAELHKGAGVQFDAVMVAAFLRALDRDGWELPAPVSPLPGDDSVVASMDHDDPTAPIQVIREW